METFLLVYKPEAHASDGGVAISVGDPTNAGADYNLPVDDFVLIGSPGPGQSIDHATDLGVSADHVFVADASDDNVSKISDGSFIHGPDITREGFGAVRFEADLRTQVSPSLGFRRPQPLLHPRV